MKEEINGADPSAREIQTESIPSYAFVKCSTGSCVNALILFQFLGF